MANIYARETALKNVVGRSDYISNPKRQEDIVLHVKNMEYDWKDYVEFEENNQKTYTKNIQARETVVALPNELADSKERLKAFCDDLAKSMYGNNRDYEYAVHWNKSRTNLHVHFIYSEREKIKDRKPKIYKRDMYVDKKTGKTCKKDNPNAVLRTKKGDIQKDKDGNIKYNDDPFSAKDKKFNNKNWLEQRNLIIQKVFKKYKFKINIFDKNSIYLPQKKLYKGAKKDYLDYAENWNQIAKNMNSDIDRDLKPMFDNYNELKPLVNRQLALGPEYDKAKDRYYKYYQSKPNLLVKIAYSLLYKDIDKEFIKRYENYDSKLSKKRLQGSFNYSNSNKVYLEELKKEMSKKRADYVSRTKFFKKNYGSIERFKNFKKEQKELEENSRQNTVSFVNIHEYIMDQIKNKPKKKQPKKKRSNRDEFER